MCLSVQFRNVKENDLDSRAPNCNDSFLVFKKRFLSSVFLSFVHIMDLVVLIKQLNYIGLFIASVK